MSSCPMISAHCVRVVLRDFLFWKYCLFLSPTQCVTKGGKFHKRKSFNYPESFLFCLYSSFTLLYNQFTYENSWCNTWRIFNSEKKVLEIRSSIKFIRILQHYFNKCWNWILKTVITTLLTVKNASKTSTLHMIISCFRTIWPTLPRNFHRF